MLQDPKPNRKLLPLPPLPIDGLLPQVGTSLEKTPNLVLQSSPGSGKTTRVPSFLLNASWRKSTEEILVLEPRRVAAKFAARRVASELGVEVGGTVGYHFRFEKRTGPNTRLTFLTEGMLLRRFIRDPELKGVACVILDEFHERHLHTDLAISYLKNLQQSKRPTLRIIVMSATLDTAQVSQFLGQAPVLQLESKLHPIDCRYLDLPKKELADRVSNAVREALAVQSTGDILVFLPGMGEIRKCESTLSAIARQNGVLVLGLHGDLSREEQDRAIEKQSARKIVLSTNIAESALTIEGLTCVIDSGLHRLASYSWWSGVPLLATKPISKASCIQRMGRAGRLGPGLCIRLFSKHDMDSRIPYETPEILRADLSQSVLELKSLGVGELKSFPWYAPPSETALSSAETLLIQLGALNTTAPHAITPLGREMVEISLHPRLSRFLIECKRRQVLEKGAALAALISEGALSGLDPFIQLDRGLDPYIAKVQKQLVERLAGTNEASRSDWHDELSIALLTAYPDRIAFKRKTKAEISRVRAGEVELQLSSGGSVVLSGNEASGHLLHGSDYFIALEIQELKNIKGHSQLYARSLCPIKEDWLFQIEPSPLTEEQSLSWDRERRELKAVSQLKIGRIILDEKEANPSASPDGYRLWLKEAFRIDNATLKSLSLNDWVRGLGNVFGAEEVELGLSRLLLCMRHNRPADKNSVFDASCIEAGLESYLVGKRRVEELHWNELFELITQNALGPAARNLGAQLPSHVALPGGRQVLVHYSLDKAPWIESRLQDFFGMSDGPKVLNGSLALTLHLLAPNYKAVQVTNDLSGFWQRTYPIVKKELGRRYPRHSWPDNPLTASPPKPKPRQK